MFGFLYIKDKPFWSCILRTVCSLLLLCWGLWGCSSSKSFNPDPPTLPTGVENTSDTAIADMYDKLTSEDVQVIAMGDDYLISIPSSEIFRNQSPKLKSDGYEILDDVVTYLQSMRKIMVKVTAYSDCYQSQDRTTALTKARAKAVGRYLWSRNIETAIVFTEGAGSDKPIVAKQTGLDSSPNSRVEITFRQVVS